MAIQSGARLGANEVLASLGASGMGEFYPRYAEMVRRLGLAAP